MILRIIQEKQFSSLNCLTNKLKYQNKAYYLTNLIFPKVHLKHLNKMNKTIFISKKYFSHSNENNPSNDKNSVNLNSNNHNILERSKKLGLNQNNKNNDYYNDKNNKVLRNDKTYRKSNQKNNNEFTYKIEQFHKSASKYSLKLDEDEISKLNQGKPNFLKEENQNNKIKVEIGGYKNKAGKESERKIEKLLQPGKKMVLKKKLQQKKLSREEKEELKKRRIKEEKEKARLMTKEEKKLIANQETAIDRYDQNYWAIEKKKLSQEIQEVKKTRLIETRRIFNSEDLPKFNDTERLSKRLARLGVASRRQAEKMINNGMIKVDGQIVSKNVPVDDKMQIQIFSNQEFQTPIEGNIKVWLFYKPTGYVSDSKDERKRPTIYQFLAKKGFPNTHFIPVGKLDYSSEGLMVLTNNGDMASALESNNTIERVNFFIIYSILIIKGYKIRFFGRMFSQEKVERIRRGVMINKRLVKYWVETIRQRHTNSWIHLKSYNNSISDIRNVFERLSLRINRIIRTDYGPFRIGKLKNPGDVVETFIPKVLNTYMYFRYKEKLQKSLRKLDDTKLEIIKDNMLKDQRRKLMLKSNLLKKDISRRLNYNDKNKMSH